MEVFEDVSVGNSTADDNCLSLVAPPLTLILVKEGWRYATTSEALTQTSATSIVLDENSIL
jgi:hypothetical protein